MAAKLSDERTLTDPKSGDEYTVYVNKVDPVDAYMLITQMGGLLVPAIVALKQGKGAELQPIVEQFFKSLTPDLRRSLMIDLFKGCTVVRLDKETGTSSKHELSKGQAEINRAFTGNIKMLFRALGVSLEVNFADFFDGSDLAGKLGLTQFA